MRGRYLGRVGRHKPCVPMFGFELMSPFGTIYFAMTVAVDAFGRHGATHDLAQRGVGRSGRESVMAVDRFCRNAVGPHVWECEAMGSMVWVKCATSAECVR